jgi:K+-transporting ATPase c subunit
MRLLIAVCLVMFLMVGHTFAGECAGSFSVRSQHGCGSGLSGQSYAPQSFTRTETRIVRTEFNGQNSHGHNNAQGFQRQDFRQFEQREFRRANAGQNVDIQPTGLARLLGLGGPQIRIRGGAVQSVEPTGLARLLGTGGPRIRSR